jgi:hypothetical protein
MVAQSYRIASTLEVQHYRELLQPINDFLATSNARGDAAPAELIDLTQAVFAEVTRFGYVPTQEVLLVGVDEADQLLDAPPLDSVQASAARRDLQRLLHRLLPPAAR